MAHGRCTVRASASPCSRPCRSARPSPSCGPSGCACSRADEPRTATTTSLRGTVLFSAFDGHGHVLSGAARLRPHRGRACPGRRRAPRRTTSATAWWWPGTPTTSPSSRRPDHALTHPCPSSGRTSSPARPRPPGASSTRSSRPRALLAKVVPGAAATGRSAAARPAAGRRRWSRDSPRCCGAACTPTTASSRCRAPCRSTQYGGLIVRSAVPHRAGQVAGHGGARTSRRPLAIAIPYALTLTRVRRRWLRLALLIGVFVPLLTGDITRTFGLLVTIGPGGPLEWLTAGHCIWSAACGVSASASCRSCCPPRWWCCCLRCFGSIPNSALPQRLSVRRPSRCFCG